MVAATSGCSQLAQPSAGRSIPSADEAAVRDFADRYAQSFVAGDPEGVVALMTDDFTALTPDKPAVVGKEAVLREIRSDLTEMEVQELRFTPEEIVTKGDWAWTWGRSAAKVRMKTQDQPVSLTGKYLWVLTRTPDGTWRIACDSAHGD